MYNTNDLMGYVSIVKYQSSVSLIRKCMSLRAYGL
jgi:hypothetical protein